MIHNAVDQRANQMTITDMERLVPYPDHLRASDYERELHSLHVELVKLQRWVRDNGERIVIVFEGRDAAGKGGSIRRFTEHLNPRCARVVALPKPNETESTQWYFQRYVQHLPAAGEIVLFDRSWYNRAGVEHVMGFCSPAQYSEFFRQAPVFERALVQSGVRLFKLWFTVSKAEQRRRFDQRREDPLRQWKLSPMDAEATKRFAQYGRARDTMLSHTDHADAPWIIVNSNEKRRARLESIRHVIHTVPYSSRSLAVARAPDPRVVTPAANVLIPATKRP